MTQDEADQGLGSLVREALVKGMSANAEYEFDAVLDVTGIGRVLARIRVGRLDVDAKNIY